MATPLGAVDASISTDGTLVYVPGGYASGATRALVGWIGKAAESGFHFLSALMPTHVFHPTGCV